MGKVLYKQVSKLESLHFCHLLEVRCSCCMYTVIIWVRTECDIKLFPYTDLILISCLLHKDKLFHRLKYLQMRLSYFLETPSSVLGGVVMCRLSAMQFNHTALSLEALICELLAACDTFEGCHPVCVLGQQW